MVEGRGVEAAADWRTLKSGENYVGYRADRNFMSPGGVVRDMPHVVCAAREIAPGINGRCPAIGLSKAEPALLNKPNGRIVYGFPCARSSSRDGTGRSGQRRCGFASRSTVQPPGAAHGLDVDEQGNGIVTEQRLYQLIRQPGPGADRQFEIQFLDPGVEAFAFTFG